MTDLSTKLATGLGSVLERRFSRRSVLGRTAVVGAAVAVGGVDFVLRPTPAYASVCGSGASCGDGWTAMCCTINNGVNQCPAGSFAGGWWKADSAGLCGGSARYYIDCQGECTHCGCGGGNFCAEGCWNCRRHCASGTCDERRVCWNVFRYGQCEQQIGCSGPVLCRMISCVPPWHFLNCTTDAATDNNTTNHSAPCLPGWSATQARYAALGGAGSFLGAQVNGEFGVPGGTRQNTLHGRLYDGSHGVHYLRYPRDLVYDQAGGPATLGLPTTDEIRTSDGHAVYQELANNGSVYSSPTGTYVVSGPIHTRWVALGREHSALGYPAHAPTALTGGGTQQLFQRGAIVASLAGTFPVLPPAYAVYEQLGSGVLGVPTADAVRGGAGTYQHFTHGYLAWVGAGRPYAVTGALADAWDRAGGATGRLGYPTAAAVATAGGGTRQAFAGGVIAGATSTGLHALYGPIATRWLNAGADAGSYGLPTSDIVVGAHGTYAHFQHGTITVHAPGRPAPYHRPTA